MIANLILEASPPARPGASMRSTAGEGQFEKALRLAEAPAGRGPAGDAREPDSGQPDVAEDGQVSSQAEAAGAPDEEGCAPCVPSDADALLEEPETADREAPINVHLLSFAADASARPALPEPAGPDAVTLGEPPRPSLGTEARADAKTPADAVRAAGLEAPHRTEEATAMLGVVPAGAEGDEGVEAEGARAPALVVPEVRSAVPHAGHAHQVVAAVTGDAEGTDAGAAELRRDVPERDVDVMRRDLPPAPAGMPARSEAAAESASAKAGLPAPEDLALGEARDRPAAAAAAPAPAPAAPQRPATPLVRAVAAQLADLPLEDGRVRLQLKPHGMGLIEVELIRDMAGRQEIAIRVQNPMVLEALRAERGAMQELLAGHGHGDGLQLDLFHRGASGGQADSEDAGAGRRGAAAKEGGDDDPAAPDERKTSTNPTDIVI